MKDEIRVEYMPLRGLVRANRNAKRHRLDELEGSMRRFGYTAPMLLNEATGRLVAGHGRLDTLEARKAAGHAPPARVIDRGDDWYVPVLRGVSFRDEREAEAYILADNRLVEIGGYDNDLLAEMARDVAEAADGLEGTGWTQQEIDDLAAAEAAFQAEAEQAAAEADEAAAGEERERRKGELADHLAQAEDGPDANPTEELRRKWQTERGQLWIIPSKAREGEHRLLIGDSTKPEDVARLMNGRRAVIMQTDAPYGIDHVKIKDGVLNVSNDGRSLKAKFGDIKNDEFTDGPALQAFLERMITAALPHLDERTAFYFWHPMLTQGTFFAAAAAADILIHRQIIWVKPHIVLTRSGMYHWKHELCFYGWVRGHQPPWYGDKSQTSVWEIGRDGDAGMHPTQKPVELFVRPLNNHTKPNEIAYEPFSGSGSQFLACEQMGRLCYGMEIEPKYAAVVLERLSLRGLTPRLVTVAEAA